MNPVSYSDAPSVNMFFDRVANFILEQYADEIPDLRRIIVLLPNNHVAQPLAQALASNAQRPALLLPQMVTLNDWILNIPLTAPVVPDICRAAILYQSLRERRWFADADLWGIANELLGLLNEMTLHHVTLPQNEEDFLIQLEQAYQARHNAAMQFEARVVHELWYALNTSGELDAAHAYQQRLAGLAHQAERPLIVLLASGLAMPDARFIEAYAEHATVSIFDLREMAVQDARCAVLQTLTPAVQGNQPSLLDQATYLQTHYPQAALHNRLRLFGAHSLEQEARAAEVQVRRWLLTGKQNIALVAQDRLVARRVRALLERAGILVKDESGWTMSTLAVSTVLMRWLDALQSDFYYRDLLDLLKSPFIFADLSTDHIGTSTSCDTQTPQDNSSKRKQAIYQLEQLVRKHGIADGSDGERDRGCGEWDCGVWV